jgi:glycosyltransferase involved in cell wall biosynthesis
MGVSVVIPTRNRSVFLSAALGSVLRQQGVELDVIIVDEASTDDTTKMLAAIADSRVRVIRHDIPQGLSAARNHGAHLSRGEWIGFLDDDDIWAPDKLACQLDAAVQARRHWVYTGSVNIDGGRIVYSRPPLPPEETVAALPRYNAIPGGGSNVLWRRDMWLRVGPFDTRFQGGEDWELSIRSAKDALPAWVCRPLVAKRVHASNMFLDVSEIIRAAELIETLHHTRIDWGRLHRWLAERYLRAGQRRAALGQFARAAIRGQWANVAADVSGIVRSRLRGSEPTASASVEHDAWAAAARAWLQELDAADSSGRHVTTSGAN